MGPGALVVVLRGVEGTARTASGRSWPVSVLQLISFFCAWPRGRCHALPSQALLPSTRARRSCCRLVGQRSTTLQAGPPRLRYSLPSRNKRLRRAPPPYQLLARSARGPISPGTLGPRSTVSRCHFFFHIQQNLPCLFSRSGVGPRDHRLCRLPVPALPHACMPYIPQKRSCRPVWQPSPTPCSDSPSGSQDTRGKRGLSFTDSRWFRHSPDTGGKHIGWAGCGVQVTVHLVKSQGLQNRQ